MHGGRQCSAASRRVCGVWESDVLKVACESNRKVVARYDGVAVGVEVGILEGEKAAVRDIVAEARGQLAETLAEPVSVASEKVSAEMVAVSLAVLDDVPVRECVGLVEAVGEEEVVGEGESETLADVLLVHDAVLDIVREALILPDDDLLTEADAVALIGDRLKLMLLVAEGEAVMLAVPERDGVVE
jgi:hypothetical protein